MPLPACLGFPFLAALPEHPGLGDSIAFQFNGMLVVFIALGLIWAAMALLGLFFKRRPAPLPVPTPARPATAASPVPPAPTAPAPLPPEVVVAITAAVHATLRGSFRIHAIVPVTGQDWAQEGRRQLFSSHQVR